MNTTLALVVSAIVLLVTALVVISIFGTGIGQMGAISNPLTICEAQAQASCSTSGGMPLTWDIPTVVRTNSDGSKETIPCRTSGARGSCDEYSVNTPGGTSAQTKKANGVVCTSPSECSSNNCMNGFCRPAGST